MEAAAESCVQAQESSVASARLVDTQMRSLYHANMCCQTLGSIRAKLAFFVLAVSLLYTASCDAAGGSVRRELRSGVWVSIPKGSEVLFAKPDRWQVTPPAGIFKPSLNGDATGYFDLIRSKLPLPTNLSVWAAAIRKYNKQQGFKKITVRAYPKQQAIEELYYDPKQKTHVAAKRLVTSGRSYVQSYFSSLEKNIRNPGVRAMRHSVLSLSRRR